jgi:hypothetical protein
MEMIDDWQSLDNVQRAAKEAGVKVSLKKYEQDEFKELRRVENEIAKKVSEAEDEIYGRKNTKKPELREYEKRAEDWAKSQGFDLNSNDEVNGFSAAQAKKHDIAHPIAHELTGLDSKGINEAFGGIKDANGRRSLLGEEAIVNVVEQLSRGDSFEGAIMGGIRTARALSPEGTPGRDYVRSPEFLSKLYELGDKVMRADNHGPLMELVRKTNIDSGTVTQSGTT